MAYPPLPTIVGRTSGETLQGYGVRVLTFVMLTSCTATLSLQDLELADHAYPIALSPDMSIVAVARLSSARHMILSAIACRRDLDTVPDPVPEPTTEPPAIIGGSRVPNPVQPFSRPPSGQKVEIRF